jgi:hypothetical protein
MRRLSAGHIDHKEGSRLVVWMRAQLIAPAYFFLTPNGSLELWM